MRSNIAPFTVTNGNLASSRTNLINQKNTKVYAPGAALRSAETNAPRGPHNEMQDWMNVPDRKVIDRNYK